MPVCTGGAVPAPAPPAASPLLAAGLACPPAAAAAPSPAASVVLAPAAVAVGKERCGLKDCSRHSDSTALERGTPAHFQVSPRKGNPAGQLGQVFFSQGTMVREDNFNLLGQTYLPYTEATQGPGL